MPEATLSDTRFESAAALLPVHVRRAAMALSLERKSCAEEFRLRAGRPFSIVFPEGERTVSQGGILDPALPFILSGEDISMAIEMASRGSAYTVLESVRAGFITVGDGHRLGICGQAVVRDGEITTIKAPSSVSIRIARQIKDVAQPLIKDIMSDGRYRSTLILSPPGCGKTTLLRDLVRQLSSGSRNPAFPGMRVSLIDERNEIAAQYNGVPQLDIGSRTDVITGCPKPQAVMMLLRSMSPQIIALDEITAPEDIQALASAANCGVGLLATAHADGIEDLRARPLYQTLLKQSIFRYAIIIAITSGKRTYEFTQIGGEPACSD